MALSFRPLVMAYASDGAQQEDAPHPPSGCGGQVSRRWYHAPSIKGRKAMTRRSRALAWKVAWGLAWTVCCVAAIGPSTAAQAEDFYQGKTIRLIIGSGEASGVDILGRIVARHLTN